MNAPNIKEIFAKLSVLKNNLSLLLPILIAVVGLLLVIPTRFLSARLRSTIENNSVKQGKEIDALIRDMSSEKRKSVSPKQLDAMAEDANAFEKRMEQAVKRELLSYALFPKTPDQSRELFVQFGQRYRQGVAALVEGLKPGECPTLTEIQTALASASRSMDAAGGAGYTMTPYSGGGGGGSQLYAGAGGLSLDSLTDAQHKIFDQLCLGKAEGARIYASLSDVAGYTDWGRWTFEDRDKAYRDCWYSQLGYWIIEDVMATIQQMNGSAESVLTAPVKRLVTVGFTFQRSMMVNVRSPYATAGRTEADRPVYVTGPTKGIMTTACTGRVCNDSADVVHFDVRVVVDATQVLPFMQALCSEKEHHYRGSDGQEPEQTYKHNQITILEITAAPVEPKDNLHAFYRYGDRKVVDLDLICEYLFNKAPGYEGLKPAQAKADLGVTAAAAPK